MQIGLVGLLSISSFSKWSSRGQVRHLEFKAVHHTHSFAEILMLGTGDQAVLPPPLVKEYLNGLGIQLDVMNSVRPLPGLEMTLLTI